MTNEPDHSDPIYVIVRVDTMTTLGKVGRALQGVNTGVAYTPLHSDGRGARFQDGITLKDAVDAYQRTCSTFETILSAAKRFRCKQQEEGHGHTD